MISKLPKTPELIEVAKRVVWFKKPEDTLEHPLHFMTYLMTYGLPEDVQIVQKYLSLEDFKYCLEHAYPGIFDPRSWAYWNIICKRYPVPTMPERKL